MHEAMKRKHLLLIAILVGMIAVAYLIFFQPETTGYNNGDQKKKYPNSENPEKDKPTPKPTFDKNQFSIDQPSSPWVVVNKQRPLRPMDYVPADLVRPSVETRGTQYVTSEVEKAIETMFAAAQMDGFSLRVDSAYRSYSTQVVVYNREVNTYGRATADTQSARPGHSEHQTGLAVDFGASSGRCSIADCFGDMNEGKWLAAYAYKYGFVLRYPEGKADITGYRYEPWHYRYVGQKLAEEMHRTETQTLEEFFNLGSAKEYD